MYKRRTYFKNPYGPKRTDAVRKVVTFKGYSAVTLTSASNVQSFTLNPLYEFVNNDSRYASFIKTVDEWRLKTIRCKVTPVSIAATTMSASASSQVVYAWDRGATY